MNNLRSFKQKLAVVSRLWDEKEYDRALAEVDDLLKVWPGNGHLHFLRAGLFQLQENPTHSLDDARHALQQAIDLDKSSPAGAIELGHFLDAVEDNPRAAAKVYAEGVTAARQLLIGGLTGQAKALMQLGKREDAVRCLLEVLQLKQFEAGAKPNSIEELLGEVFASRSA